MSGPREHDKRGPNDSMDGSSSTAVEPPSPISGAARRRSWNQLRINTPNFRDVQHRQVHDPLLSLQIPDDDLRGPQSAKSADTDISHTPFYDVALEPKTDPSDPFAEWSSKDFIQPVASSSRAGWNQPQPSSARLDFPRDGQESKYAGYQDAMRDPEMGLGSDLIPMKTINSEVESLEDQTNVLDYNEHHYGRSNQRHHNQRLANTKFSRVAGGMMHSSAVQGASRLMRNISQRVAHPSDPLNGYSRIEDDPKALTIQETADIDYEEDERQDSAINGDKGDIKTTEKASLDEPPVSLAFSRAGTDPPAQPPSHTNMNADDWPLKGKALGMFGPKNKLRVTLYRILKRP